MKILVHSQILFFCVASCFAQPAGWHLFSPTNSGFTFSLPGSDIYVNDSTQNLIFGTHTNDSVELGFVYCFSSETFLDYFNSVGLEDSISINANDSIANPVINYTWNTYYMLDSVNQFSYTDILLNGLAGREINLIFPEDENNNRLVKCSIKVFSPGLKDFAIFMVKSYNDNTLHSFYKDTFFNNINYQQ